MGRPLAVKDNQFSEVRKDGEQKYQKTCQVQGCNAKHHANGYCTKHAQQAKRGTIGMEQLSKERSGKGWVGEAPLAVRRLIVEECEFYRVSSRVLEDTVAQQASQRVSRWAKVSRIRKQLGSTSY